MIQFWVPRSEALEAALVSSLREPLLFLEFDPDTEATTVKILRSLSRLRGVEALSPDTTFRVLTNDALRARVHPDTRQERVLELVESAVVEEAGRLEERIRQLERSSPAATNVQELRAAEESAHAEAEAAHAEAEGLRSIAGDANTQIASLEATVTDLADRLAQAEERSRSASTTANEELLGRVQALEIENRRHVDARRRTRLFSVGILGTVIAAALCVGSFFAARDAWDIGGLAWACATAVGVLSLLLTAEILLGGDDRFRDFRAHKWVKKTRLAMQAGLGAVIVSVLAGFVYHAISTHLLAATLFAHEPATFGEHGSAGLYDHGGPLAASMSTISPG
jgi:hypothetical protein